LPSILFMGFSYILSAILNSINHFTVPAFLPVINNGIVILLIVFLHHSMGIYSVAIGFIAGAFLQVILQIPALKKSGIQYKLRINFMDKDLRKIVLMSFPIIGLVLIDQCSFLATRYFSSSLDPGSASALNYASRIISLPITLFGTALVTAVYPSAILMHEEQQFDKYDRIVKTGLKSMLLIFMPTSFICVIYAPNITRILFERGAFDSLATQMTAICLIFLAISIILLPIKEFIVRLFYSKSMIKIPLLSTLLSLITFISSCIMLVPRFKYIGIAVASSLSLLISLLYLIFKYNAIDPKRKIRMNFGYITKVFLASSFSSSLSFLLYWICLEYWGAQKSWLIITVLSIGINVVVYLVLIKIFKIKEIDFVFTSLLSKFNLKRREVIMNES
jgi:putative peptidoglycan lipid II flippase